MHNDYYPYVEVLREYNNSSANEKYKSTGKERDGESGLDCFGARYYDSGVGRWLAVDPMADKYPGWSPYNYCANNPVKYTDPDGRLFIIDDFIVGLVSGLISGKSISQSVDQGVQYAANCVELWSSFGRGDFGQVVSKCTCESAGNNRLCLSERRQLF